MDQVDTQKIETDDNCALIIDIIAFITFLGTIALLWKKITECMSKLASLYYSVTNVYAKCTMQNGKKNKNLFSYFLYYSCLNLQ